MGMRRRQTRSLAVQALALRGQFPEGKVDLRPARLVWTGTIQPTPLSRQYRVKVTYRATRLPVVRVLDHLEGRPGEPLPHVYREGTLCLHLPGEWTPEMLVVDSTLPWTAEWLINYEIWKATGEWHGGGQWPPVRRLDPGPASTTIDEAKSPRRTQP
jgi:hypothetical protein